MSSEYKPIEKSSLKIVEEVLKNGARRVIVDGNSAEAMNLAERPEEFWTQIVGDRAILDIDHDGSKLDERLLWYFSRSESADELYVLLPKVLDRCPLQAMALQCRDEIFAFTDEYSSRYVMFMTLLEDCFMATADYSDYALKGAHHYDDSSQHGFRVFRAKCRAVPRDIIGFPPNLMLSDKQRDMLGEVALGLLNHKAD